MNLKEKSRMLGLGCYGGKQVKEFMALGYKGEAANGSEQDLKALGDIPKYQLQGFDGFGGHRERALDCLAQNSEFMDFVENIKEEIVFVFFGGGGSTGSGCATIVAEMSRTTSGKERITMRLNECFVFMIQSNSFCFHRQKLTACITEARFPPH